MKLLFPNLRVSKKGNLNPLAGQKEISDSEISLIEAGLNDLEEGNTFTHHQVMHEIDKLYDQ